MKKRTKSPIKDRPLRVPGQSLEEEQRHLVENKFEQPLLVAAIIVVMAVMEWFRYFRELPPAPVPLTIAAILAISFVIWRFLKLRGKIRALRQGLEGERVVGQYLEALRGNGYSVFHDLIGNGFNVDHVLIGPAGVFSIETKTWSKPAMGEARIKFNGISLVLFGKEPECDPVVQAKSQAAWLKTILSESTGRHFEVFPVVLFPGWYIEQSDGSLRNIWVLEPKALPKFLENAPVQLEPADVKLASYHLGRIIRSSERERDARR